MSCDAKCMQRQIELDGTESNVEILSELRAQFNCFDEAEEPVYRALSDAIRALSAQPEEKVLTEEDYAYCLECNHVEMCRWYPMYGCEFKSRPSAQPSYTDEQIQKMQDLEQAEIEKAFQLGKEDAQPEQRWISCSERLPKAFEYCLWTTTDGKVVYHYCDGQFSKYIAWMPLPYPYQPERRE